MTGPSGLTAFPSRSQYALLRSQLFILRDGRHSHHHQFTYTFAVRRPVYALGGDPFQRHSLDYRGELASCAGQLPVCHVQSSLPVEEYYLDRNPLYRLRLLNKFSCLLSLEQLQHFGLSSRDCCTTTLRQHTAVCLEDGFFRHFLSSRPPPRCPYRGCQLSQLTLSNLTLSSSPCPPLREWPPPVSAPFVTFVTDAAQFVLSSGFNPLQGFEPAYLQLYSVTPGVAYSVQVAVTVQGGDAYGTELNVYCVQYVNQLVLNQTSVETGMLSFTVDLSFSVLGDGVQLVAVAVRQRDRSGAPH